MARAAELTWQESADRNSRASRSRVDPADWVGHWGRCSDCDGLARVRDGARACEACLNAIWGDPNGIEQERSEQRGRQRYRVHQVKLEQQRRRTRLALRVPTKGKGPRQRALREVILDRAQRQYPFTAGCNETRLGTDPSNTAHVVANLEGVWLERAGDRLPAREHLSAHGEGSQRRCPGLLGAQPWLIKGLSEREWQDLSLSNEAYGVKQLPANLQRRVAGALRWAIECAEIGTRSYIGSWLIRRLVGWELSDDEQDEMMAAWYREVPEGGHPYTWGEMRATIRSGRRCYDRARDVRRELQEMGTEPVLNEHRGSWFMTSPTTQGLPGDGLQDNFLGEYDNRVSLRVHSLYHE